VPCTLFLRVLNAQYPEYRASVFEQLWLSRSESAIYRAQIDPVFEKIRDLAIAH
jgi:hypothetical protein